MNVIATRYDYYIEIETEMKHAVIFFVVVCPPFRSTWVHPLFLVRFVLLGL